eukprot:scpid106449/ scgid5145/ 
MAIVQPSDVITNRNSRTYFAMVCLFMSLPPCMSCLDEDESSYGDPFEHSTFIREISPWLGKLPATTFRNKAQDAGFFTDLQQIRALTRTDRQHGPASHNAELIDIVSSEEQAGFIKLVKVIKHWGKYPDKVDKM